MFRLSALYRYPIKSSAAESLGASLDALGVVGDRRWMAVVETGRFFTQRLLRSWGVSERAGRRPEVTCG